VLFDLAEDGKGLTLTTAERVDMTLTALEQITDWATWRHVVFSTGFRSVRGRARKMLISGRPPALATSTRARSW
jgi:hypothetical protein